MASITLENVCKVFGSSEIIRDVSLHLHDGLCAVFVGPSGCGKSTLLRIICGLETVTSGRVFIGKDDVTDLPPSRRGLAMVFQSYALYPHMTVFENMAFALEIRKFSKKEIHSRVLKAAKALKIEHLLGRKPKELSGGQRQRVAIGRCIVRNPYVFLFDEPLSNLDTSLRYEMRYEIARLKNELKTTMIYVTHDQEEAMILADKIVVMRDGKVEQVGSPMEIYNNPINTFVAGFIGTPAMNFFNIRLSDNTHYELCGVKFECVGKIGNTCSTLEADYILGIRPHDIEIVGSNNNDTIQAKVTLVENFGSSGCVHAIIKSGDVVNIQVEKINCAAGDNIYIKIPKEKCYFFYKDGTTIINK